MATGHVGLVGLGQYNALSAQCLIDLRACVVVMQVLSMREPDILLYSFIKGGVCQTFVKTFI